MPRAPAVVIATASVLPLPDPDEPALLEALRARGADVRVLAWDDDHAPFEEADVVVVRSTWNYVPRRDAFVAWAERVGRATRLWNPAPVLRDNTDKIYLRDLAARGVPVVPTAFLAPGERVDLAADLARRGWDDVVIKPRVSAGSFATERFGPADGERAARFLAAHLAERPMMVQPYQDSVEGWGERSLVWIDGAFTHATRKSPRFAEGPLGVSGALPIEDDERALGERALAAVAGPDPRRALLYARVDVVRGGDGAPQIMEIELCEPYLMLDRCPAALERLADAIVERAR